MQTFADSSQKSRSGHGETTAAQSGSRLFADLATFLHALSLSHRLEAVTFANALPLTGIFCGFAIVHAFARRHAVAVNLSRVGSLSLSRNTGKQGGSGESESGTSGSGFEVHFCILGDRQGCRLERCSVPTQH
jgi:hypothetical protein